LSNIIGVFSKNKIKKIIFKIGELIIEKKQDLNEIGSKEETIYLIDSIEVNQESYKLTKVHKMD
jgi:hypothetical protein